MCSSCVLFVCSSCALFVGAHHRHSVLITYSSVSHSSCCLVPFHLHTHSPSLSPLSPSLSCTGHLGDSWSPLLIVAGIAVTLMLGCPTTRTDGNRSDDQSLARGTFPLSKPFLDLEVDLLRRRKDIQLASAPPISLASIWGNVLGTSSQHTTNPGGVRRRALLFTRRSLFYIHRKDDAISPSNLIQPALSSFPFWVFHRYSCRVHRSHGRGLDWEQ